LLIELNYKSDILLHKAIICLHSWSEIKRHTVFSPYIFLKLTILENVQNKNYRSSWFFMIYVIFCKVNCFWNLKKLTWTLFRAGVTPEWLLKISVTSGNASGRWKITNKRFSQNSLCPIQNLNEAPPKYKSDVLWHEPTCLMIECRGIVSSVTALYGISSIYSSIHSFINPVDQNTLI
jgi:hypothetical protein